MGRSFELELQLKKSEIMIHITYLNLIKACTILVCHAFLNHTKTQTC